MTDVREARFVSVPTLLRPEGTWPLFLTESKACRRDAHDKTTVRGTALHQASANGAVGLCRGPRDSLTWKTCSWGVGLGVLCSCQVRGQLLPRPDQPRCSRGPGITSRKTQPVESPGEIPHEVMTRTDHLAAGHGLQSSHAAHSSFAMLMILLTALLLQLPSAVLCLRQNSG